MNKALGTLQNTSRCITEVRCGARHSGRNWLELAGRTGLLVIHGDLKAEHSGVHTGEEDSKKGTVALLRTD